MSEVKMVDNVAVQELQEAYSRISAIMDDLLCRSGTRAAWLDRFLHLFYVIDHDPVLAPATAELLSFAAKHYDKWRAEIGYFPNGGHFDLVFPSRPDYRIAIQYKFTYDLAQNPNKIDGMLFECFGSTKPSENQRQFNDYLEELFRELERRMEAAISGKTAVASAGMTSVRNIFVMVQDSTNVVVQMGDGSTSQVTQTASSCDMEKLHSLLETAITSAKNSGATNADLELLTKYGEIVSAEAAKGTVSSAIFLPLLNAMALVAGASDYIRQVASLFGIALP